MRRAQRQVLAIVEAAPEHVREFGVHAFYVRYGGHGLPRPVSIEASDRELRRLATAGLLVKTGTHPTRYTIPGVR